MACSRFFIVFMVKAFLAARPASTAIPLLVSSLLLLSVAPLSISLCRNVSSGGTAEQVLSVGKNKQEDKLGSKHAQLHWLHQPDNANLKSEARKGRKSKEQVVAYQIGLNLLKSG